MDFLKFSWFLLKVFYGFSEVFMVFRLYIYIYMFYQFSEVSMDLFVFLYKGMLQLESMLSMLEAPNQLQETPPS